MSYWSADCAVYTLAVVINMIVLTAPVNGFFIAGAVRVHLQISGAVIFTEPTSLASLLVALPCPALPLLIVVTPTQPPCGRGTSASSRGWKGQRERLSGRGGEWTDPARREYSGAMIMTSRQ